MEIRCPHCNQVFDLSEDAANHIREQIRTKEFNKELDDKVKMLKENSVSDTKSQVNEAILQEREKYEKKLEKSNKESSDLRLQVEKMKAQMDALEEKKDLELEKTKLEVSKSYQDKISDMEATLKATNSELEYFKDLKAKMSTKMVGETLEQHCEIEFNKIRMAAFPKAQFGKDNEVSKETGSKGDYIFREYDENGVEIISIMFEMKNEMQTTTTKHKNEHFFKELDKDRKEKKCEYAVLVSLLEADNELYNQGIVDVSYEYDKMYVIRPQMFIPIITILRNAALNSLSYKKELVQYQNEHLDAKRFEENLNDFKVSFSKNFDIASRKYEEAIDEIDKTIDHLQKVKAALTSSGNQLRLANNKATDLSIKKLTKNCPSIRAEFSED